MGMADEPKIGPLSGQAGARVGRADVLPDGVARAAVPALDAVAARRRLPRSQPLDRRAGEPVARQLERPQPRRAGLPQPHQVDRSGRAVVVISHQRHRAALARPPNAMLRVRAAPDHIPEVRVLPGPAREAPAANTRCSSTRASSTPGDVGVRLRRAPCVRRPAGPPAEEPHHGDRSRLLPLHRQHARVVRAPAPRSPTLQVKSRGRARPECRVHAIAAAARDLPFRTNGEASPRLSLNAVSSREQPASAPGASPTSGARATAVVKLTTMPSASPVTAPTAIAAQMLTRGQSCQQIRRGRLMLCAERGSDAPSALMNATRPALLSMRPAPPARLQPSSWSDGQLRSPSGSGCGTLRGTGGGLSTYGRVTGPALAGVPS
jgi:hypothetical protein